MSWVHAARTPELATPLSLSLTWKLGRREMAEALDRVSAEVGAERQNMRKVDSEEAFRPVDEPQPPQPLSAFAQGGLVCAWCTGPTCSLTAKCLDLGESGKELTESQRRHVRSMQLDGTDNPLDEEAMVRVRQANVLKLIAAVNEKAGPKLSYLDVGSGTGDMAQYFAEQVDAERVVCYDVCPPEQNSESIAAITNKKEAGRLRVNVFDGTSLPEESASFDAVSCIFVLHHAGKAQVPLLHDMVRVSKKWILICEDLNEKEFVLRNKMVSGDSSTITNFFASILLRASAPVLRSTTSTARSGRTGNGWSSGPS